MKVMWMIIFFVLPIVGMSYVLWHIWQMLPWSNPWRWTAVGIWGGKFRIGTRSEYVVLTLKK